MSSCCCHGISDFSLTTAARSISESPMVRPITSINLDRVVDLITKTNQFNLTTRRHSRAAVEAMAALPRSLCLSVRLVDRFGDYGIVAVVLALPTDRRTLHLDTWLMSCRAMGRTVEYFALNHLASAAHEAGFTALTADYLPTAKNIPVETLLPDCGFVPSPEPGGLWTLDLTGFEALVTPGPGLNRVFALYLAPSRFHLPK
jgi:predicted enzyme involved in methoxymalonyl-ACP biosynthesis